jgi:UDPglucose 6-dehydrogenase
VICVDKDKNKIAKLEKGISPIYEPGLEEVLRRTIADGYLTFTTSTPEATHASEIVFIAVGTPPRADGTPDLTAVKAAAADIAKGIKSYKIVVNKSTVPVGSGDLVEEIISQAGVPQQMFDVVSNPEFLREGSAIQDSLSPDRIVIGAKRREAGVKLVELYAPLERPMIVTDVASAELIKYASNSFLATKISFINAISRISELCGANVADVAKGMGTDSRIGPQFLQAGLGYGGSCFPKDVQGLVKTSESLGYEFGLLKEVMQINEDQTLHFMRRLGERLGGFKGRMVGLLGLAFKPNTDDIRDAKSLIVIEHILSQGGCVRAYDPAASELVSARFPQMELACSAYEVSDGADALVVVTEWNEFRQLDLERLGEKMRRRLLFDGRRVYSRVKAERAGFEYATIGA